MDPTVDGRTKRHPGGVDAVSEKKRRYASYLLRLWSIEDEGRLVWRASLESPHTGERWGFASLDALFTFLRQETIGTLDPGRRADDGRREE
jgi:hypothetical protein